MNNKSGTGTRPCFSSVKKFSENSVCHLHSGNSNIHRRQHVRTKTTMQTCNLASAASLTAEGRHAVADNVNRNLY